MKLGVFSSILIRSRQKTKIGRKFWEESVCHTFFLKQTKIEWKFFEENVCITLFLRLLFIVTLFLKILFLSHFFEAFIYCHTGPRSGNILEPICIQMYSDFAPKTREFNAFHDLERQPLTAILRSITPIDCSQCHNSDIC